MQRINVSIVLLTLACMATLTSACNREPRIESAGKEPEPAQYIQSSGDLGEFLLRHALHYGGRAVATNGLPIFHGDWQFVQDKYGVGVLLPLDRYDEAERFFTAAFGPRKPGWPGWAVSDVGVTIFLLKVRDNTEIGIHPQMSEEELARGVRELTESIDVNPKR